MLIAVRDANFYNIQYYCTTRKIAHVKAEREEELQSQ